MIPLKDIATLIIPPHDPDPKVSTYRWLMWATTVGLVIAVAWLGFNAARAGELEGVKREISDIKRASIEGEVFKKSIEVCSSEGQLRIAYNQELSRLISEWRTVTGDRNSLPPTYKSCRELGLAE